MPSRWTALVAQVHAMSGADEKTILSRMPYARALQYQNYWRMQQGVSTRKPKESQGLKTIL